MFANNQTSKSLIFFEIYHILGGLSDSTSPYVTGHPGNCWFHKFFYKSGAFADIFILKEFDITIQTNFTCVDGCVYTRFQIFNQKNKKKDNYDEVTTQSILRLFLQLLLLMLILLLLQLFVLSLIVVNKNLTANPRGHHCCC